ncbi:MAG TPA: aminoacyl-tRNA hydrolase [Chitinophagaceae bacterium]|nr:aminoacyl-tRNA hydrolase [Chitinophagaceae bacterium]
MKYLITGLGNPGPEYAHTRHNIGFDVLEAFAKAHGLEFRSRRLGELSSWKSKGRDIILLRPSTYVNLSGEAVKYWMDKEKIPLEHLLVVLDEIALPLNALRLRPGGSDGGHNGLKSIAGMLGTEAYCRLRFGIGKDYPRGGQVHFVLGPWKEKEQPLVARKTAQAVKTIEEFIFRGPQAAMNSVNQLVFE